MCPRVYIQQWQQLTSISAALAGRQKLASSLDELHPVKTVTSPWVSANFFVRNSQYERKGPSYSSFILKRCLIMEALWENRWLSLKLALQPLHDYPFTKFSWEYDASLVSDDQNCAFEGISASWLLLSLSGKKSFPHMPHVWGQRRGLWVS